MKTYRIGDLPEDSQLKHSDRAPTDKQIRYLKQLATDRSQSLTEDDLHCVRCTTSRIDALLA